MTEHKRLRQITRAIRNAVAEALFTASGWLRDAAYWAEPPAQALVMMGDFVDWREEYAEITQEAWDKLRASTLKGEQAYKEESA